MTAVTRDIKWDLDKTEGATSIFHLTSLFVYSGNQMGSLKTMNCQFILKKSHCLAVYILQICSGAHSPCHPAKIPFLFFKWGCWEPRVSLYISKWGQKRGPFWSSDHLPCQASHERVLRATPECLCCARHGREGGREMHSLRMLPWEAGPFERGELVALAQNVKRNCLDSIVIPRDEWLIPLLRPLVA